MQRFVKSALCLSSTVLSVGFAGTASAALIVSPTADTTAPGDAQSPAPFNYHGTTGSRNQTLYPAASFAAVSGPQSITDVKFRPYPNSTPSGLFPATVSISNVIITFSTTVATESGTNALSATYASNVGTDVTTVYSGPLTLTSTATNAPGGTTKVFDYDIPLQVPFTYNPAAGNLLMDVTIPNGATVGGGGLGFIGFDVANDAGDGIASVSNLNSGSTANGSLLTSGTIAQFTTTGVPEPASIGLLAGGAVGLLGRRRRA